MTQATVAVLLAGGLARRMGGGDKPLQNLAGRPLLDHVAARIRPQVHAMALNANGDPARFAGWTDPVVPDTVGGNPGPLAGVLAGMRWARRVHPKWPDLLSVPTDTPFLPHDLVARLASARARDDAPVAVAASGGQLHHTIALWSTALRDDLRRALVDEDCRAVHRFAERYSVAPVVWPQTPVDPFFNANTLDDLGEAERLAGL